MAKPKLALYWAASCGGCEIAILELHEKVLAVDANFEVVFWPVAMDAKYKDGRPLTMAEITGIMVGTLLGEMEINISRMQLALHKERGEAAMLVNVDKAPTVAMLATLREQPQVISAQLLELGP